MDHVERRRKKGALKTRLLVSATVLLLGGVTGAFERPGLLASFIVAYALLTVLFWDLSSRGVEWRPIRAIPMTLDLTAVSLLVWSTGGLQSSWFLLYLFPILSATRYLGSRRSLVVTAFAMIGYGIACSVAAGGAQPILYPLGLRAMMFAAVALTAGAPVRARERTEAKLLQAIDDINRAILAESSVEQVTRSILDAAMENTNSELSAIRLADGTRGALASENWASSADDVSAVARILDHHYQAVFESRQPLALPRADLARTSTLLGRNGAEVWAGRIVPMAIGDTCLGVLGVFSRRRLQYTHDDARRLSSLAHLIAIAQKNAKVYTENRERLQLLYEVGKGLSSEQSLDLLFRNVVKLVSAHLGSEEAALFLPTSGDSQHAHDGNGPLKKVAVAGPSGAVEEQLSAQEELYEDQESLTGRVFASKTRIGDNHYPNEPYATSYAELLPSRLVRHYLGTPLLIGDEVLGVVRVLNKKAKNYRAEAGAANLANEGFSVGDLDLLSAIATQVASAIRNARFVEQHAYFRNLVYNSPYPIVVIDKFGRVGNLNREAEKLLGLSEEAVLGTHVSTVYQSPEHAREIVDAVWAAAAHGQGIRDYPVRIRKLGDAADEIIPIRLAATGFLDKDGRPVGVIGIFTDEREVIRAMEEKIRAGQLAALGRLAHTTGHDIKHDIATIRNWADILKVGADNGLDTLQACAAIETATSRAMAKLQNMLMTADPKPPNMEPASLRAILMAFEASVMHEARATHVDFRLRYPEGDHLLLADSDQMRQLFTNLFGNSLDAIKRARELRPDYPFGRIELDVTTGEDVILLSWYDNGSGISEEVRAKAFMPLFTTKATGNGLGLFITRTIVERHGGRIDLEPVSGGGARFTIRLPLLRFTAPADSTAALRNV
jgi:PAS domain S-box-containing protein